MIGRLSPADAIRREKEFMSAKGKTNQIAEIRIMQEDNVDTVTGLNRNIQIPQTVNYKPQLPEAKLPKPKQIPVWDALAIEDSRRYQKEQEWLKQDRKRRLRAVDHYNSQ